MLRRRGINISAWDVERVFAEHEAIAEVALVGVPSDLGEDELKLFVRLRDGVRIEPLELIRWSSQRLPYFQVPRYIEFIDASPRRLRSASRRKNSRQVAGVQDAATTDFRAAKH